MALPIWISASLGSSVSNQWAGLATVYTMTNCAANAACDTTRTWACFFWRSKFILAPVIFNCCTHAGFPRGQRLPWPPFGGHGFFGKALLKICFNDEAGDLGKLGDPPRPNDQPVLVIGGLFVDADDSHSTETKCNLLDCAHSLLLLNFLSHLQPLQETQQAYANRLAAAEMSRNCFDIDLKGIAPA